MLDDVSDLVLEFQPVQQLDACFNNVNFSGFVSHLSVHLVCTDCTDCACFWFACSLVSLFVSSVSMSIVDVSQ